MLPLGPDWSDDDLDNFRFAVGGSTCVRAVSAAGGSTCVWAVAAAGGSTCVRAVAAGGSTCVCAGGSTCVCFKPLCAEIGEV